MNIMSFLKRLKNVFGGEKEPEEKDKSTKSEESKPPVDEKETKVPENAKEVQEKSKESAEAVRGQKTQEAIKEAQGIIEKAREASRLEHEGAMNELKRDFGRLVIDVTSKVTGKVLDDKDQKRINEEAVGQVAL